MTIKVNKSSVDGRRHDEAVRGLIGENANIRENLFKALSYIDALEEELTMLRTEHNYVMLYLKEKGLDPWEEAE